MGFFGALFSIFLENAEFNSILYNTAYEAGLEMDEYKLREAINNKDYSSSEKKGFMKAAKERFGESFEN